MKNATATVPSGLVSEMVKATRKAGVDMVTDLVRQYCKLLYKYKEFDVIQVLFKPSSIFQRFD